MHARGSDEDFSFLVPLPSRAISHARGHLRVSCFARRTTEKRETARCLGMFESIGQLSDDVILLQLPESFSLLSSCAY